MISCQTIDRFQALHDDGPRPRKFTPGPEIQLVHSFLKQGFSHPLDGEVLTIFIEPRVESGFPDIVAAYWDAKKTLSWSSNRPELSKFDLRAVHYLYQVSGERGTIDQDIFPGFDGRKMRRALQNLKAADIVYEQSGHWRLRPLDETFVIRRLISIEAKISGFDAGLQQAFQNTWFASETYLLVPKPAQAARLLEDASRLSVGLVSQENGVDAAILPSRREALPKSYVSWQFNEWIWRSTLKGRESASRLS